MFGSFGDLIRSEDNPLAKRIRSLRQRKTRETERAFVVEGVRAVEDALAAGGNAEIILVRSDSDWMPASSGSIGTLRYLDPRLFDELSETVSPQPLLAVFSIPELIPHSDAVPFVLIADGLRDPGNLGTLLRSAAAAGVNLVLLTPGTVDAFNGKVVRAAMGAHFRIPIDQLDDTWHDWLAYACHVRVLADAAATREYTEFRWAGPLAIIVGSEAEGPTQIGRELASDIVRIPLENGVESLNAGVAGSLILFEARRQLHQHNRSR